MLIMLEGNYDGDYISIHNCLKEGIYMENELMLEETRDRIILHSSHSSAFSVLCSWIQWSFVSFFTIGQCSFQFSGEVNMALIS